MGEELVGISVVGCADGYLGRCIWMVLLRCLDEP